MNFVRNYALYVCTSLSRKYIPHERSWPTMLAPYLTCYYYVDIGLRGLGCSFDTIRPEGEIGCRIKRPTPIPQVGPAPFRLSFLHFFYPAVYCVLNFCILKLIMGLHLQFFVLFALAAGDFALDSDLLWNPSYDLFSSESRIDEGALPYDQTLLPLELASNQESSAVDDELFSLSADASTPLYPDNSASDVDDFSIASDLFASTDCSSSDSSLLPTIGKPRRKRQNQCGAGGNYGSSPMLSIPTVEDLDPSIRETILRENPALHEFLRLAQDNSEQSSVCILLTNGRLIFGGCPSYSTKDWMYRGSMAFSWNPAYIVTLWNVVPITPGMIDLKLYTSNKPSDLS